MKYCPKCGTELADDSMYCSKCGAWQYVESQDQPSSDTKKDKPKTPKAPYNKSFVTVNKILLVILCASLCITVIAAVVCSIYSAVWLEEIQQMVQDLEEQYGAVISLVYWSFANFGVMGVWIKALPLAWVLPMTLHYFKKSKANESTTLTYKICMLIFAHTLVGIFMLIFEQNAEKQEGNEQFRDGI